MAKSVRIVASSWSWFSEIASPLEALEPLLSPVNDLLTDDQENMTFNHGPQGL